MRYLQWKEGPKARGCVYHKLARHRAVDSTDSTYQIDVFVMPSIAHVRPIAITVARYVDGDEAGKHKLAVSDPLDAARNVPIVSEALDALGLDPDVSPSLAGDVQRQLEQDAVVIRTALGQIGI